MVMASLRLIRERYAKRYPLGDFSPAIAVHRGIGRQYCLKDRNHLHRRKFWLPSRRDFNSIAET